MEKSSRTTGMAQQPFNLSAGAVLDETLHNAAAVPENKVRMKAASALVVQQGVNSSYKIPAHFNRLT